MPGPLGELMTREKLISRMWHQKSPTTPILRIDDQVPTLDVFWPKHLKEVRSSVYIHVQSLYQMCLSIYICIIIFFMEKLFPSKSLKRLIIEKMACRFIWYTYLCPIFYRISTIRHKPIVLNNT